MKTQTIKPIENQTKYEKIYHISDIHIRNTEEHKKIYEHVFTNLFKYLKSVKNKNSLIVITGDILHNKDKLTSTGEEICINFFAELSTIMDTVIIPGNHDFNEKNNTILDSISIILYKRTFKNLYYLKDSGVYRFNNILFGVSSLIDKKFVKANEIEEDGLKIALYHGAVSNSKNSKGFEFSENSITKFDGYDLALLGDIHFHQYLNEEKTIAYSSSLISQNFSETDINHGVLVWNLKDKTSEYKIISNDYQFSEINIKKEDTYYQNKLSLNDKLILPKYAKLKITYENCNQENYNTIINIIKYNNPNVNIVHNKLISNINIKKESKSTPNDNSLKSVIDNEIKEIPEKYQKNVEKILYSELKNSIQIIDTKLNWKLISLTFSNMFTYGKDNIIDFTKLTFDEITGLFGPNSSGKSSLVDILLFSLFDDYSRNNQDKHKILNGTIINTNENYFSCCVRFLINNNFYEISKAGKRKKAKAQFTFDSFDFTKYDFYKIVNDENISLNGVDRIETLSIITKLIGTYNDFCISSICFQTNSKTKIDFYTMTPTERKNFLHVNFNLDGFKLIENKYKNIISDLKSELKTLHNLNDYKLYVNNDLLIEKIKLDLIEIKKNNEEYKNMIKSKKEEYDNLVNNLKPIDEDFKNYSVKELKINIDIEKLIIEENKKNLLKMRKYDFKNNKAIHNFYQKNIELTKKLIQFDEKNVDIDKLKYKLEFIKFKMDKLELVKNKKQIIDNNIIFEKDKINKIIELKSKIIPKYIIFSKKFSEEYINNFENIYDNTLFDNYDSKINELIIKKNFYETRIANLENNNFKVLLNKFNFNPNCESCSNNLLIKELFNFSSSENDINNLLNLLKNEIKQIENKIVYYKQLSKNSNIVEFKNKIKEYIIECKQNNYIIDLYIIENTFDKNIKKLNKQLLKFDKLKNKQQEIIKLIDNYNNNINIVEHNNEINKQIENNKKYIDNYSKNKELHDNYQKLIKETNENIEKIQKNITNLQFNESIKNNISSIKIQLNKCEDDLSNNNNLIFKLNNNIEDFNDEKIKYNEILTKINNLTDELELNTYIFDLVCSKGIPRKIINIKLQIIEDEVNNILKNFITKRIEITKEIEDLKVLINENNNKINFGGGMEQFLIMLAFKVGFISVFNIPHCGLLVIDEGVSVLDKEHVGKFNVISDFIKKYYNHIILITHIDSFYDFTVGNISIIKKNNKSLVNFI